jgi:membrane associated rhomboid family serine protease
MPPALSEGAVRLSGMRPRRTLMLVPYQVDVPMARVPWANWVLIAVTCAISLALLFAPQEHRDNRAFIEDEEGNLVVNGEEADEHPVLSLALKPKKFSFLQLCTFLFVHAGIIHLAGNMIFLFVFGNAINAKLGHVPFLLAYFLLGAFTGVCWLIFGNGLPVIGASGAIAGLMGMFLFFYPKNEVEVLFFMGYTRTFSMASGWLIVMFIVWDLLGTLLFGDGGVAFVCHLGGEFAGLAAATIWRHDTEEYEENLFQAFGWQPKEKVRRRRSR